MTHVKMEALAAPVLVCATPAGLGPYVNIVSGKYYVFYTMSIS